MKSFLLTLMLVVATQVNAAQVELGKYRAVDADTKSIVASFELKADGTVEFQVKSPDISPGIACSGKYTVNGNEFATALTCKSELLPKANVKIDISNVTAQAIRSEKGAEVSVIIDALGDEAIKYLLKKND